ncbi:MAG: DUF4097 family beta strand repeat protein [Verrucomicrobia bacterium]|nr:DUF4097 family beta strand repeat protein [Verrucomicrobiota bacterium]
MKTHLLFVAAGLLALAPIAAQAKIERVVEKTFTVQPGGTLTVETQGGDVRILTSKDSTVKVTAKEKIKAGSESEADELLKKLTLTMEQVPEGVSALAKYEKPVSGWRFGSWPPVQVDFIVTVPANYNVSLKTTGGDIKVPELGGKVYARTSGGDVTLGKIAGEIDAGTSGGDVRLTEGGATVHLTTSGGDIHVDRAVGATDLDTSGGDIVIKSVENTLHASTSGGNVTAGIIGALKGECRLSTSGGRVRVTVDNGTAFDLNASTSGGVVDATGLTITIEKGRVSRSKLEGKVNGGGPLLKLRSSGGDISVQTR